MRKITQHEVDELVPELNAVCEHHNTKHPEYPLLYLPTDTRVIHVLDEKNYATQDANPKSVCCSIQTLGPGKKKETEIFVHEKRAHEQVQEMRERLSQFFGSLSAIKKTPLLALLHHENIHRSCHTTRIPKRYQNPYAAALRVLVSEAGEDVERLERALRAECRFESLGFGLSVYSKKERAVWSSLPDFDELVTQHLTSASLANFLKERNNLTAQSRNLLEVVLFAYKEPDKYEKVAFLDATRRLQDHRDTKGYIRFMQDYIHSTSFKPITQDPIAVLSHSSGAIWSCGLIMDQYGMNGLDFQTITEAQGLMNKLGPAEHADLLRQLFPLQ